MLRNSLRRTSASFPVVVLGALATAMLLAAASGCGVNVPVDPESLFRSVTDDLDSARRDIQDAIEDPLDIDPFPVLLGGDSTRVFYATNLADIRLNFPGPTNDVIIPGFTGPTNLYVYDFSTKRRQLLRPLVPSVASQQFGAVDTDGTYAAFLTFRRDTELNPLMLLFAGPVLQEGEILFAEQVSDSRKVQTPILVEAGRVAYLVTDFDTQMDTLHVADLAHDSAEHQINAPAFGTFDLRHDRLAYVAQAETSDPYPVNIVIRDLTDGGEVLVAERIRVDSPFNILVFLTDNSLVWSEPTRDGTQRVLRYDIPTGTTEVWADAIDGWLTGAADAHFVTEEYVVRDGKRDQRIVRRHDLDGKVKKLAEFSAEGVAGQSSVIGDHAAWVNPERKVILAPLAGGDRRSFKPF